MVSLCFSCVTGWFGFVSAVLQDCVRMKNGMPYWHDQQCDDINNEYICHFDPTIPRHQCIQDGGKVLWNKVRRCAFI